MRYGQCQNCGKIRSRKEMVPLESVKHLLQRVDPGEPMPIGECHSCGALMQPISEAEIRTQHNKQFDIEATVVVSVCATTKAGAQRKAGRLLAAVTQDVTIN